jgi:transcriptional regulator with XRE-family HTH domain
MLQFQDLQEALRRLLWERIESGELTGMGLAEKTGFRQAHISNFLNRKRGLSLDGMDRVLQVEDLSILDLIPSDEINARASIPPPEDGEYANLLLIDAQHGATPQVHASDVIEVVKFKRSILRRLHAEPSSERLSWLRFVLMKPTRSCCEAMSHRLAPGSVVLLDRHYTSLVKRRRGERLMYAVQFGEEALVRYINLDGNVLTLQPERSSAETKLIRIPESGTPDDFIIGRVAYVSHET